MAIFPCDFSTHRYPGPQRSMYVSWADSRSLITTKLRLCENHFLQLLQVSQDALAMIDDDSQVSLTCEQCHKPREGSLFVKYFDERRDPVTYAGDFCASCVAALMGPLKVANGRALGDR